MIAAIRLICRRLRCGPFFFFPTLAGMISDVQSLNVSCDNIGVKTRRSEGPVSIEYTLGCDDDGGGGAFFNNDGLMCTFTMRTLDAM